MSDWTRESALRWMESHANREIVVRMRGSAFRAHGTCKGVSQLDACSAAYQECHLVPPGVDAEVVLCFHSETLSVHLIAYHPDSDDVVLSLPVSIPFSALILSDPGAAAAREEEPDFWPYELL